MATGISALFLGTHPLAAQIRQEDELPLPTLVERANAIVVTGHALDVSGKPIKDARVAVVTVEYARSARPLGVRSGAYTGGETLPKSFRTIGPVATDGQGSFEVLVPPSFSGNYAELMVFAEAPGHGFASTTFNQIVDRKPVELRLGAEHVVRGRLIDLKGQPAAGVKVSVRGPGRHGWCPAPNTLNIWQSVVSDDKGRFLIRGWEATSGVRLLTEGPDYIPERLYLKVVPADSDAQETVSLSPAKRIHGRITFGDTGQPAVNARIISPTEGESVGDWVEARTDANGDYSINPFASNDGRMIRLFKGYRLNVLPADEQFYVAVTMKTPTFSEASQQIDIKLERGLLLHGRITESQTQKPIARARVQFIAQGSHATEATGLQTAISGEDGAFKLPVPAMPGHLLVLGPTLDYIPVETSGQELEKGGPPGKVRWYANAVIPVDGKVAMAEKPLDIKLRTGVTLKGKVLRPDGQPASEFALFSSSCVVPGYQFSYSGPGNLLECRDGEFELRGCDPEKKHVVHFYERKSQWGAVAELSAKNATEPAQIRLEQCGSAEARLVDANGKPHVGMRPQCRCALTDGVPNRLYAGGHDYALEAILFTSYVIDRRPANPSAPSDENGRTVYSNLIPGARYMINWTLSPADMVDATPWPHLVFTVKSGETKDLGEIKIKDRWDR